MSARILLIVALLLSLPGVLWQAYEMYGLTLGGEQMLFFSIAHTMPAAVLLVLLALPAGLVVLLQAVIGYVRPRYLRKMGLSRRAAGSLVTFFAMHFAALATYEIWAAIDVLRVPICVTGLAILAVAATITVGAPSNHYPAAVQSDA